MEVLPPNPEINPQNHQHDQLSRRDFLKRTVAFFLFRKPFLYLVSANASSPVSEAFSALPLTKKQQVENEYGVKFDKWTDHPSEREEECILTIDDVTEPDNADVSPRSIRIDRCQNLPLELDDARILIAESTFKILPSHFYRGAILVPARSPYKSYVAFEDPDVIHLLTGQFNPNNKYAPSLLAHELGHRLTFRQPLEITWEEKLLSDGVSRKPTLVECEQFDRVYEILGGGYHQAPESLKNIATQFAERNMNNPESPETMRTPRFEEGVRYFIRRNYPVEVGPVLVEHLLRPVFDANTPRDYFMRHYTEMLGKETAEKLYRHTMDYFFKGRLPTLT